MNCWSFVIYCPPLCHTLLPGMHRTSGSLAAHAGSIGVPQWSFLPGNAMEARSGLDTEKHGHWQSSEEINYSINVLIRHILYFKLCFSHNSILCFLFFILAFKERIRFISFCILFGFTIWQWFKFQNWPISSDTLGKKVLLGEYKLPFILAKQITSYEKFTTHSFRSLQIFPASDSIFFTSAEGPKKLAHVPISIAIKWPFFPHVWWSKKQRKLYFWLALSGWAFLL